MKKILLFAGTTEGRKLSECLCNAHISHTVCVATEYGEILLKPHFSRTIHQGRMDQEKMRALMESDAYDCVVDATHPYAHMVTENIKAAAKKAGLEYIRLQRDISLQGTQKNIYYFENLDQCAKTLETIKGNILLTTGSKELSWISEHPSLKDRLYVRVLPNVESIQACFQWGIGGKQILALQGPFTTDMNVAMLRQYKIGCLVTKQSGRAGGFQEKLDAARALGIPVCVIGNTSDVKGDSFFEVCKKLQIQNHLTMEILLAGVGMGHPDSMTFEVRQAIEDADIILGAKRMIEPFHPAVEKKPYYKVEDILPYLNALRQNGFGSYKIVVLFSGDTGFFSGAKKLKDALEAEGYNLRILPGISSIAYLSARLGECYEDAQILSLHGKEVRQLAQRIRYAKKTYMLMSGKKNLIMLRNLLDNAGLEDCEILAGFNLSYDNEKIFPITSEVNEGDMDDGLYTCAIRNPAPEKKYLTHGLSDAAFIRDRVPMTKEEVREVSLCKLKLYEQAVVYDLGSGTGSIAVEIARLSPDVRVHAIEQKAEAIELIEKNKSQWMLDNIDIWHGRAPEILKGLEKPTHAFIGGSSGNLQEILKVLYEKNPQMRVVINAVSLETLCEIKDALDRFPVKNDELITLQATRTRKISTYHMMQAENPIWICAFDFCKE